MTPLEASTTFLFHADTDFREKSARRVMGDWTSTDPADHAALSSAQAKFGTQSIRWAGVVDPVGVHWPKCAPFYDFTPITMECWTYFVSHINQPRVGVMGSLSTTTGGGVFQLRMTSTGTPAVELWDSAGNNNAIFGPSNIPTGQWVHLVATVNSNRWRRLYVNGVLSAASGTMGNQALSSDARAGNGLQLGGLGLTSNFFYAPDAYIDEARYVVGYPIYEQNMAVPSSAFSDGVSGDSLLLHGEGSNGGTTITDSSTNALTPTQVGSSGNVTTSTSASRFGSASLLFGGTHAISYASSALFEAASRDWTIEFFMNADVGTDSNVRHIFQLHSGSVNNRVNLSYNRANNVIELYTINGAGTGGARIQFAGLRQGTWQHIALTKEGLAFTLWIDGVPAASTYNPVFPTGNLALVIGYENFTGAAGTYVIGNIDEFRATMGVARYPLNFTPPTSAYSDLPTVDSASKVSPLIVRPGASMTPSKKVINQLIHMKDTYDGGRGWIVGTVKEKALPANTPLHRKVWLVRERDGRTIRETWSNATTGDFAFYDIDENERYSTVAYDYLHNYRAVIADNLQPSVS